MKLSRVSYAGFFYDLSQLCGNLLPLHFGFCPKAASKSWHTSCSIPCIRLGRPILVGLAQASSPQELNMHIELQQAMQHLVAEQSLNIKEISRFTPVDFRLGIQYLVAQDQPDLAQALAEAGLALYPLSEDILAISGLLAITREDWPLAVEILQDLVSVQNNRVQPMTYQMLARALACNLDVAEAHQVLETALQKWPNDATLIQERKAMATAVQDAMPAPSLTN
jgi:tetratricopeptide (TPR) repeat protein